MSPTKKVSERRLIRCKLAQHELGIGHTKFWDLVAKGHIQTIKLDGMTMVLVSSLDKLISEVRAPEASRKR